MKMKNEIAKEVEIGHETLPIWTVMSLNVPSKCDEPTFPQGSK